MWRRIVSGIVLGGLLGVAGCEQKPASPAESPEKQEDASLSALPAGSLRELSFPSGYASGGVAALKKGIYEESAPDAHLHIELSSWVASGDMNGDGQPDSAVVLVTEPGGSGVFYELALVMNDHGQPGAVQVVPMGDRIQLRSLKVQDGLIRADVIEAGPGDPACCPSQRTTYEYWLEAGRLMARALPAQQNG